MPGPPWCSKEAAPRSSLAEIGGAPATASLRAWILAAKLALELVAREQVAPVLH